MDVRDEQENRPFSLNGKVSFVTGGYRGPGMGMAEGLAWAGSRVVLVGRGGAGEADWRGGRSPGRTGVGLFDPEQIEGKAEAFADWEDRHILMDTMIFCRFYRDFYPWEVFNKVVKLLTGVDMSEEALRAVSRAVHDDKRRFNLREGLTPQDDRLPSRLLKEVLPEAGKGLSEAQMLCMLEEYYKARNWDAQGRPQSAEVI